jgi:hypothetical protein
MWKPSTRELEIIIEHSAAKVPAEKTAEMLGIDIADLRDLARRLAAGHALMVPNPLPPLSLDNEDRRPSIWSGFPVINK